jgi:hypothetical protein
MGTCRLCKKNTRLNNSHIIPSFIGKWLKETSITGFLRHSKEPNLRKQDLITMDLLCSECENIFSKYENYFAKTIFYPYVQEELDESGVAQANIKTIKYNESLLKFVISLQWRQLVSEQIQFGEKDDLTSKDLDKFKKRMGICIDTWGQYLRDEITTTGEERHYIVFLQNLITGEGNLPENLNKKINFYLLRSVDNTLGVSSKKILIYTKLGPIVILSSIKPFEIKKMKDYQLRKNGELKTAQNLQNYEINEFIFITRPNEVMPLMKYSEKQQKKISTDFQSKLKTAKNLNVAYAIYSDQILSNNN